MALFRVLNPVGEGKIAEKFQGGAPVKDLSGKAIGLFWNGKHNGDVFLLRIAELLQERFKDTKIVRFDYSFEGVGDAVIKEMADKSDIVLGAMGD